MSCSGNKRSWEAPVAATLSIRSTAATMGPGSDAFVLRDFAFGPRTAAVAPLADVGAPSISSGSATVEASAADPRTWEAPAVAARSI